MRAGQSNPTPFLAIGIVIDISGLCSPVIFPQRADDKHRLHIVLQATLWTDCFLGMLTGYGARSGILVAATLYKWLVVFNALGATAAVFVVFVDPALQARQRRRRRQQARRSRGHGRHRARPPSMPVGTGMFENAHPIHGNDGALPNDKILGGGGGGGKAGEQVKGEYSGVLVDDSHINPNLWPTRATLVSLAKSPRRVEWIKMVRRAREFRYTCETCPEGQFLLGRENTAKVFRYRCSHRVFVAEPMNYAAVFSLICAP